MIWPADVSRWLVNATGATGQIEGMMILAGLSLWYSVVVVSLAGMGAAVVAMINRMGGK